VTVKSHGSLHHPVGNSTMALLPQTRHSLSLCSPRYPYHFPNPYYHNPFLIIPATSTKSLSSFHSPTISFSAHPTTSRASPPSPTASASSPPPQTQPLKAFAGLAASAVLFLCFGVRLCLASSPPPPPLPAGPTVVLEEQTVQGF